MALDFQFDSTNDGREVKIASMVDKHTRLSLLNVVDRSIPARRLTDELDKVFALWGGPPDVLRMDNGPEFISDALRDFCSGTVGILIFRRERRGTAGSSSRSTTGYGKNA